MPHEVAGIRYVWAGRHDDVNLGRTDGYVRTAQIEAYRTGESLDVEQLLDTTKDDKDKAELDL